MGTQNKNLLKIEHLPADPRGSHDLLIFKNKSFRVIVTKKGYLRGGDFHPSTQHCLLLYGKGSWTIKYGKRLVKKLQKPNKIVSIKANTPHLFEALEDSLMIEWLQSSKYQVEYDAALRKLVMEKMKKKNSS